jgi:hypothetical protein
MSQLYMATSSAGTLLTDCLFQTWSCHRNEVLGREPGDTKQCLCGRAPPGDALCSFPSGIASFLTMPIGQGFLCCKLKSTFRYKPVRRMFTFERSC